MTDDITESTFLAWIASAKMPADHLRALMLSREDAESVYREIGAGNPDIAGMIPPDAMARLKGNSGTENLRRLSALISAHRIKAMTFRDPEFPRILREIEDPVSILFYQGNPACLSGRTVSMVGSRRASYGGLKAAQRIARDLSREGVSIVSGFAYGIDSASHRGCLEGGSPTAAVLGCGLDQNYPADNAVLREKVLDAGGVFLSEYAPGEKPLAGHFPYRNRIISAIGDALVLMEAKIRSGSLRTVDHALKQGKDIFVYPGEPDNPFFEGNHRLLRDGARYFTTAEDILEDMNWLDKKPRDVQNSGCSDSPASASPAEDKIRKMLAAGEMSFEQIAAQAGLLPAELLSTLTIMQIRGIIEPVPGKKYQLKR